jgi:hypothetical protein
MSAGVSGTALALQEPQPGFGDAALASLDAVHHGVTPVWLIVGRRVEMLDRVAQDPETLLTVRRGGEGAVSGYASVNYALVQAVDLALQVLDVRR